MNNCTFAGRAGRDAEIRKTSEGQSVANFSLAVDRYRKDEGPIWIKVVLWGKQADNLTQYITKGKQLAVSGSVDLRTYETSGGETRTELTLNAQNVTLLGGGEKTSERAAATDENIPF
jgi:single-strand DNA-binding protein